MSRMVDDPGLPVPAPGFSWTDIDGVAVLTCKALAPLAEHAWTTRQLRLRGPGADEEWERVHRIVGVGPGGLARLRQVHGATVIEARHARGRSDANRPDGDIVVSDDPAIAAAVVAADCVPLLIADRSGRAVCAVHAGWRGTVAGAARAAVERMAERWRIPADALVAGVGPSIGPCCYHVGRDVARAFRVAGWPEDRVNGWIRPAGDGLVLDLWRATADQLLASGVPAGQIWVSEVCTACHEAACWSYRRDGDAAGRMAGVIRLPPRPSPRWPGDRPRG